MVFYKLSLKLLLTLAILTSSSLVSFASDVSAEMIKKEGVSPGLNHSLLFPALREAYRTRDMGSVISLLDAGVDPNIPFKMTKTSDPSYPITFACNMGDIALARLLLIWGADPSFPTGGENPLFIAVERRDYEMACLLRRWGAKILDPCGSSEEDLGAESGYASSLPFKFRRLLRDDTVEQFLRHFFHNYWLEIELSQGFEARRFLFDQGQASLELVYGKTDENPNKTILWGYNHEDIDDIMSFWKFLLNQTEKEAEKVESEGLFKIYLYEEGLESMAFSSFRVVSLLEWDLTKCREKIMRSLYRYSSLASKDQSVCEALASLKKLYEFFKEYEDSLSTRTHFNHDKVFVCKGWESKESEAIVQANFKTRGEGNRLQMCLIDDALAKSVILHENLVGHGEVEEGKGPLAIWRLGLEHLPPYGLEKALLLFLTMNNKKSSSLILSQCGASLVKEISFKETPFPDRKTFLKYRRSVLEKARLIAASSDYKTRYSQIAIFFEDLYSKLFSTTPKLVTQKTFDSHKGAYIIPDRSLLRINGLRVKIKLLLEGEKEILAPKP